MTTRELLDLPADASRADVVEAVFGRAGRPDTPRLSVSPPAPPTPPGNGPDPTEPAGIESEADQPTPAPAGPSPVALPTTRRERAEAASAALAAAAAELRDCGGLPRLQMRPGEVARFARWLDARAELLALVADAVDHAAAGAVHNPAGRLPLDACHGCSCDGSDHVDGVCLSCGDCEEYRPWL